VYLIFLSTSITNYLRLQPSPAVRSLPEGLLGPEGDDFADPVRSGEPGINNAATSVVGASDELIQAHPEIALLLSRLESLIEARGDKVDASGDSQIRKLNELLRLVSQGLKFEPLKAHWAAFEAPSAQLYAQPSDLPAGIRPQEPQATASATPRAPVYQLFAARTVADAWREWTEGISGGPAVGELESARGHRWHPEPKTQVAWNPRKEILDEVQRLINRGHSEEAAVAELERRQGGRSLRKLVDELKARKKASGMV
jgi:hypothetical protein